MSDIAGMGGALPPGFTATPDGAAAPVRWITAADFNEQVGAARSLLASSAVSLAQTERDPVARTGLFETIAQAAVEELPDRAKRAMPSDEVGAFRRAYTDLWRAVTLLDFEDNHVVHVPRSQLGVAAAPTVFEAQQTLPAVEPLFRHQAAAWSSATGQPADTFLRFTGGTDYVGGVDGTGHIRIGGTPVTMEGMVGADGLLDRIGARIAGLKAPDGPSMFERLAGMGRNQTWRGARLRIDPEIRYQAVSGLAVAMDRVSDIIDGVQPLRLARVAH